MTPDTARKLSHTAAVAAQKQGYWAEFAVGTPVQVVAAVAKAPKVLFTGVVVSSHDCDHCRVVVIRSADGLHKVDAARVRINRQGS